MSDLPHHICDDRNPPFADEASVRNYVKRIESIARNYEFASFTVGTLLKLDLPQDQVADVKRNLNRRVALGVYEILPDREPMTEKSDVAFLLHYPGRWVDVIPSPLYIYGRYLKHARDLPHARWLCMKCRGKGCNKCDGKGKVFESSVEEIIAEPLLEAFGAEASKMHATGRQDVDVRMLGGGRPFAVELVRPRKRTADLALLQEKINRSSRAVAVRELRTASREIVRKLDTARADKTYRATVAAARPVNAAALAKLEQLSGTIIHQRTPQRVAHRRADKVRDRGIRDLSARPTADSVTSDTFELEMRAESGTYVKEMISGDDGRTRPSVAEVLGMKCVCRELDVIDVHFDPYSDA